MTFSLTLAAVDVHAEGEPGRVITDGIPDLPGETMLAKMRWMEANADHIRQLMLREPRGYPGLCCNVLVPPTQAQADIGFIIMEQTEYAPMSGSNLICVVTAVLETGIVPMVEPITELTAETPAGLIKVRASCAGGKVTNVRFQNVPSFALHLDAEIDVPQLGPVRVDIAWGGMFFVIADADELGIDVDGANGSEIARVSEIIRTATVDQLEVVHPIHPELTGPSISQLTSTLVTATGADRKNAVTLSTGPLDWNNPDTWTGALDRCPCGTGTSAQMAVLHARGQLSVGDSFTHEGPLGTTFAATILSETTVGPYNAIVPELEGQGWITGTGQYLLDSSDPFPTGFTVGDIWP